MEPLSVGGAPERPRRLFIDTEELLISFTEPEDVVEPEDVAEPGDVVDPEDITAPETFTTDPEASVGTQDRLTAGVFANPSLAL
jgi:hypothetical protein